jgi:hypothetical protein
MSADIQGAGFILIGPKGTKKTEIFFGMLRETDAALHSADMVFVRYGGGMAAADIPERKFYIPTHTAIADATLSQLYERSKCENIVTRKEDCQNQACKKTEECSLDRGMSYCFEADSRSRVLLDPYWIGGMSKHVKRIDLRHIFLLRPDPAGEICKAMEAGEALRYIEDGSEGAPFYNRYLLSRSTERLELQRRYFTKLFEFADCYTVSTGAVAPEQIRTELFRIIRSS